MTQARFIVSRVREAAYLLNPPLSSHLKKGRLNQRHHLRELRIAKSRRLRCDCGQLAVTELLVRVGTDPQYTIHLPLCPACLALEQSFRSGV